MYSNTTNKILFYLIKSKFEWSIIHFKALQCFTLQTQELSKISKIYFLFKGQEEELVPFKGSVGEK